MLKEHIITILVQDYGLDYVLEVNDITHEQLVEYLIDNGKIDYDKFFEQEGQEQTEVQEQDS